MKNLLEDGGRIEDTRGIIGEVQKEMCYIILLHAVGSTLCFVIPSSMCCNSNLFYVSYFKFVCNFFLKFIVNTTNSKIIKSRMIMLIKSEKFDMTDTNMTVG
jgi:hypothetical protein